MTDTTTRTLQYRLGVWTNPEASYSPMHGVEYLGEYAEREARFNWAGQDITREQWQRMIEQYAERYATDPSYMAPRYSPIGGEWVFTPDSEPETAPDTDRSAQRDAIVAMRRREADALQRAESAEQQRSTVQREFDALRIRVGQLADALLEQAEERDWCSEYEEFQSNFSDLLHTREREYTVTLTVTVSGSDASEYDISEAIYGMDRSAIQYAISSVDAY